MKVWFENQPLSVMQFNKTNNQRYYFPTSDLDIKQFTAKTHEYLIVFKKE